MTRIVVPIDELNETINSLNDIGDRIKGTARLNDAGSSDEVGDSHLAGSLEDFDHAWSNGQERVKDNVKTFSDNVDKIAKAFQDTDDQTAGALDDSGNK